MYMQTKVELEKMRWAAGWDRWNAGWEGLWLWSHLYSPQCTSVRGGRLENTTYRQIL